MANSKGYSAAEQARRDYKRSLAAQPKNDLAPPVVVPMIAGDPDGLLDATQITDSILVRIDDWNESPPVGAATVYLHWDRADSPQDDLLVGMQPVPVNAQFPIEIRISKDDYLQGRLNLSYTVALFGGNRPVSQVQQITLDTVAPYGTSDPVALQLGSTVITDDYLEQNQDQLIATVPDYADQEPGDTLYFYWLTDVPDDPAAIPPTLGPLDVGVSKEIHITREILEHAGNGQCLGFYVLRDKAGNISRISHYVEATVALGPLPENFQDPLVPLANDGRIDRDDAHTGVVVRIPGFDNAKNGDKILVTWGATELEAYPVGPNPVFPMDVQVPWSALQENYDFDDTGNSGDQQLTVSYQVSRGVLIFPEVAPKTEVTVNLQVVGPENPDEPSPVNPDLTPLIVRGASDRDNELIIDDAGQDATAHIILYEGASAGDYIWVYWGEDRVPDFYVVQESDAPGNEVEINIPWTMIERFGNDPALPVHYIITDQAEVNYQASAPTSVSVKVAVISFPAPQFPHAEEIDGNTFLNCASIRTVGGDHGVYVHVPPDGKYLKAGLEVVMTWWVSEYPTGTPIPATEFSELITMTTEQEVNGITWFVHPYEDYILPAFTDTTSQYGLAHVQFMVIVGGEAVWSDHAEAIVALMMGGGASCPLPDRN